MEAFTRSRFPSPFTSPTSSPFTSVSVGECPAKVKPPCPSPSKIATTSNPVQLTARSMLPSWLKSPATSNSGAMMLPVRWLAQADGKNAAERMKQANAENLNCSFFIIFPVCIEFTVSEPRSDPSGDALRYLHLQLCLRLQKEPRPRSG